MVRKQTRYVEYTCQSMLSKYKMTYKVRYCLQGKQCSNTVWMDNMKGFINKPEWRSKQSPNMQQCSRQGRDQKLQASLWEKKRVSVQVSYWKYHVHKMHNDGRYLPVHHHRLVHLIKEGHIRVPVWRNVVDQQWCCCISSYSVFSPSSMLPLVLSEGVSVNLLQVPLELVLQRVHQQDVAGLPVQQLGGPRDGRQEGHQAGYTSVLEVLHRGFRQKEREKCRKRLMCRRNKIKVITQPQFGIHITFSITSGNKSFNNFDTKL